MHAKHTSSALKNLVWENAEKNNEKSSLTFASLVKTGVRGCVVSYKVYNFVFNFESVFLKASTQLWQPREIHLF